MTVGKPLAAAVALRRAAEAVAARPPAPELAPVLEIATRDLYLAMRGLARYQIAGRATEDGPGTLAGQVREAANSVGLAWRYLSAGHACDAGIAAASAAGGLRAAAAGAVSAWSRPSGTAQDREQILEMAAAATSAMAAAAGCLAAGGRGIRAGRIRDAEGSLGIAAEQLRQALACSRAAGPARGGSAAPAPASRGRPGRRRRPARRSAGRARAGQPQDRRRQFPSAS